jgi:hypothetical protein
MNPSGLNGNGLRTLPDLKTPFPGGLGRDRALGDEVDNQLWGGGVVQGSPSNRFWDEGRKDRLYNGTSCALSLDDYAFSRGFTDMT